MLKYCVTTTLMAWTIQKRGNVMPLNVICHPYFEVENLTCPIMLKI